MAMKDMSHFTINANSPQTVPFYQELFGFTPQSYQAATPAWGVGDGVHFLMFTGNAGGPTRGGGAPGGAGTGRCPSGGCPGGRRWTGSPGAPGAAGAPARRSGPGGPLVVAAAVAPRARGHRSRLHGDG